MTAQLTAYAPPKSSKFVKLDAILHHPDKPKHSRQTPEQQMAIVRAWMANRKK